MRDLLHMAKCFDVHRILSPDLEITKFVSDWHREHNDFPTFKFRNIASYPGHQIVINLWDKLRLDQRLGVPTAERNAWLSQRLAKDGRVEEHPLTDMIRHHSLADLPILRHQPQENSPYLTSFLGCILDPQTKTMNTGFYRGEVIGPSSIAVFMDMRTDAHKIWSKRIKLEREIPFVMYAGGDIRCYLMAASGLARNKDSFRTAAALGDSPLPLSRYEDVSFATNAEVVLQGTLSSEITSEGPFGEFKGYYSGTTESPVFRVENILTPADFIYPALFCGKEEGLTLMSYSNEMLMHQHLKSLGYQVEAVSFDLSAFGEYRVEIITKDLSQSGLLQTAMEYEVRAKLFFVTNGTDTLDHLLSYSPLTIITEQYMRYGRPEGQRLGIVAQDVQRKYKWCEY